MRQTQRPVKPQDRPLPRSLRLLGYYIRIKQVSVSQLAEVAKDDRPLDGFWDDETLTIYLLRRRSRKVKRVTLWHEVNHAVVDLKDLEAQ